MMIKWLNRILNWILGQPKVKKVKVSLIITTYNWPEALEQVLKSVRQQTVQPDEVVIADDGSKPETGALINMYATCLNIIHVWQPDEGFRPAMARNKAIAKATGEYIILVDGDMVLHPEFIADHLDFAQEGTFVQGKRILLDQKKTRTVLTENRSTLSHASWKGKNKILSALWSGRCYMRKLHGIKSCNMAFFRQDCLNVNGFNEDFIGWGREDSEFAARLLHSGVNRRDLSFAGIAYHLFHKECSRVMLAHNHNLYMQTLSLQSQYCKNGITVRS